MAKPRITIVGLGLIGNSIGLALCQGKREFEVVGHDKDNKAAGQAKKMKAVDKTDWNLINACEGADLVVLALPAMAIRDSLQALAGELKIGCVVMDTASIKEPVLRWAEQLLPDTVHFVGTNPIVAAEESGGSAARADLFHKATWAICSTATTNPVAVKTAADLADRLGAQPLFLDAAEHDGMLAAVEHLPALLSTAILSGLTSMPAWREMRKLAGGQFANTTRLASADPQVFSDMVLANRENLVRWVDMLTENLQAWRGLIEAENEEALAEAFSAALDNRYRWEHERRTGLWDEGQPEMPKRRAMMAEMLGFGRMTERLRGDRGDRA